MGATRKPGLKREMMAAHLKTLPQLPEGESLMALETGQRVAWVLRDRHDTHTTGVSAVHRVYDRTRTYCSNAIPALKRHLPPLPSLEPCSTCERMYARGVAQEALEKRLESARAS